MNSISNWSKCVGRGREIFVVAATGGHARQLTFDGQLTTGATWTSNSREIVFASSRNKAQGELWRISVSNGALQPLSPAVRSVSFPSISRERRRLAFSESWTDSNIHLRTGPGFPRAGMPWQFNEPVGVVVSTRADHSPAFPPDGERMVFVSDRSGNEEIYTSRLDGSEAVQLTSFGNKSAGSPRWSPDGKNIAFDVWSSNESNIYLVKPQGGAAGRLSEEPGESWMPSWSQDGESIYFTSRRSGAREIWKMPATGGAATQVTHAGAYEAHAAPDGKAIYFTRSTPAGCCAI